MFKTHTSIRNIAWAKCLLVHEPNYQSQAFTLLFTAEHKRENPVFVEKKKKNNENLGLLINSPVQLIWGPLGDEKLQSNSGYWLIPNSDEGQLMGIGVCDKAC